MLKKKRGFTLVEALVVTVIIAVLATVIIVAYNGVQRRSAAGVTSSAVSDALKVLQLYYVYNKAYPSNVADTEYAPPLTVGMALYTDAPQRPYYESLTPNQNAQLFINTCNGLMPIESGGTTFNTSCIYNGNNAHVKGQVSSNVVINGPTFGQSDFVLTCGSVCTDIQNKIISVFLAQGGTFPVTVPKAGSTLPKSTMVNAGLATRFCLEGRSGQFSDVVYHATSEAHTIEEGACPNDATLHYP